MGTVFMLVGTVGHRCVARPRVFDLDVDTYRDAAVGELSLPP